MNKDVRAALPRIVAAGGVGIRLVATVELPAPAEYLLPVLGAAPGSFLLDSAAKFGELDRWSFAGLGPVATLTARRRPPLQNDSRRPRVADLELTLVRTPAGDAAIPQENHSTGDPFATLRALLTAYRPQSDAPSAAGIAGIAGVPGTAGAEDHRPPFLGGAVGYLAYEAGHYLEALPETGRDDLGLPDFLFHLHDVVVAHDHAQDRSWLSVIGRGADEPAATASAEGMLESWRRRLDFVAREQPLTWPGPKTPRPPIKIHTADDRATYTAKIDSIRERILAGDAFEVCLTRRLEADLAGPTWALYQDLHRIDPAPFAAFLREKDFAVVSASPERFLRLQAEGQRWIAESRPIKGTRPRGATPEDDARLRQDLATSEKDRAENVMIVDLVRNDLGRVARTGSVTVPELCALESYATVFQLVSTVRAELAEGRDAIDLIRACFPGGSMTGAPKIAAMQICDELEPVARSVYSGAMGYLDYRGGLDLSIVIRTAICRGNKAWFGVGGAVLADSDPDAEFDETLAKAQALRQALGNLTALRREEGRA